MPGSARPGSKACLSIGHPGVISRRRERAAAGLAGARRGRGAVVPSGAAPRLGGVPGLGAAPAFGGVPGFGAVPGLGGLPAVGASDAGFPAFRRPPVAGSAGIVARRRRRDRPAGSGSINASSASSRPRRRVVRTASIRPPVVSRSRSRSVLDEIDVDGLADT